MFPLTHDTKVKKKKKKTDPGRSGTIGPIVPEISRLPTSAIPRLSARSFKFQKIFSAFRIPDFSNSQSLRTHKKDASSTLKI